MRSYFKDAQCWPARLLAAEIERAFSRFSTSAQFPRLREFPRRAMQV